MMWQDLVFLVGSSLSVVFLYPTLRDRTSQVPRATSVPSMVIGGTYAMTFASMNMTYSAAGAFAACTMWSLIALLRAGGESGSRLQGVRSALGERYRQLVLGYSPTARSSDRHRFDDEVDVGHAPHGD